MKTKLMSPWTNAMSLAATFLLTAAAVADSATVSYQGILRDAALAPVADGNYEMTFSIWDAPSGGTKQWGDETHAAVGVAGGVFSVYLGSIEAFATEFSDFSELWLEITADTGAGPETYAPRVPLASVPYAQHAKHADTADTADSASTADTALQADNASALGGQPPSAYASSTHTHALGELSNVTSAGPSDGQALTWNQSAGQWEGTGGYAILRDVKPNGTNAGGSAGNGWQTRTLNNLDTNIPGVSRSGNDFTLPAGRYKVVASAPAFRVDEHQIGLWNVTAGAFSLTGTSGFANRDNSRSNNHSFIDGRLNLTESTTFRLRHYTRRGQGSNGLGRPGNTPSPQLQEVYSIISIDKY